MNAYFFICCINFAPRMNDEYAYNSVTVATYVVALANSKKLGINMTKIQKLLYIAYGVYLVVKKSRLTNEHPQAWPYGPVFPTTRNKLLKKDLFSINLDSPEINEIKSDEEINALLELVFTVYGKMNAISLSEWSHQEGSPWYYTVHSENFKWGNVIPDQLIEEYFKTIVTPKHG